MRIFSKLTGNAVTCPVNFHVSYACPARTSSVRKGKRNGFAGSKRKQLFPGKDI